MIIHPGMFQVSSHVHFGFQLTDFLLWVFPCLQVSQVFICLLVVQVNGFQGRIYEDNVQSMFGDEVDQVSMGLPPHEDIKLFMENGIKKKHHNEHHHEQ